MRVYKANMALLSIVTNTNAHRSLLLCFTYNEEEA